MNRRVSPLLHRNDPEKAPLSGHVKVTRDGKLQISLIGDAIRGEELEKIRDLLLIQQGRIYVDFTPEQGELSL